MASADLRENVIRLTTMLRTEVEGMGIAALKKICVARLARGIAPQPGNRDRDASLNTNPNLNLKTIKTKKISVQTTTLIQLPP